MTFAAVGSAFSATAKTFTLAPHATGDLIIVEVISETAADFATAMSSSNVTWSVLVAHTSLPGANAVVSTVFLGQVTSTSSATVTVTLAAGSPTLRIAGMEFSTTAGFSHVALDVSGTVNAVTSSHPSLTPSHGSGELYFSYAFNSGTGSVGSTSGFSYFADPNDNIAVWNPACTNAAQAPTEGDAGNTISGIAVLLYETSTPVSVTLTTAAVTAAAVHPAPGAGPLTLPAAGITVAAVPPAAPAARVAVPAAQVTVTAVAPGVKAGPLALPAAGVSVQAFSPTVPLPGASLPPAGVTVAAHAPALAAGPVALPHAGLTTAAPAGTARVSVSLPAARVTVTALLPGLPVFVVLPAARVQVTAWPAMPPVRVALTTAQATTAGQPVAPAGSITVLLPAAQRTVRAFPPAPPVQHITVAVNGTWSAASAQPSGYNVPWATAFSAAAEVANTDRDWMIACCWWSTLPGSDVTVSVADDVHNMWVPVGQPAGTSPDGSVRCSIWAAPAARAAGKVVAAAGGYVNAVGVTVLDVSGLSATLGPLAAAGTGYQPSGSGVSAGTGPLPGGADAFYVTVGADNEGITAVTLGGGWTAAGSTVFIGGGTSSALTGLAGWATGTTAKTAAYSGPGGASYAACTIMIPVEAVAPAQSQPWWPAVQLQAAFGSGAQDPVDSFTWTDISSRFLSGGNSTATRGLQYELNALQAADISLTLDNNDLALSPVNTASPYWPDVQVDTPLRLLLTWRGRTYSLWSGFAERWPEEWEQGTRYGLSPVTVTDAWSLLTGELQSVTRESWLSIMPYGYWPLSDPATTTQDATPCANIVPGNTLPLVITESKHGPGAATWSLGNGTWLWPDDGGTVWQVAGLPANVASLGFNLFYADPAMPALTGGVTYAVWVNNMGSAVQDDQGISLIRISSAAGPIIELGIENGPGSANQGALLVYTWSAVDRSQTITVVDTADWTAAAGVNLFVFCVTPTTWTLYTNGFAQGTPYTGTGVFSTGPVWLEFIGLTDRFATGQFYNAQAAHCAVFPRVLNPADSMTLFCGGFDAFALESPGGRATRLLGYSGYLGPRFIDATAEDDQLAPSPALSGTQAGTAISNLAQGSMDLLYVDGNNAIMLQRRQDQWNLTPKWVLGENAAVILNRNWAFVTGISPWTASGGTISSTTSPAWHPWFAAVLTPSGTAATAALLSEVLPVTAGAAYTAGMQVFSAGGYGSAQAEVQWLNSGGGVISVSAGRVTLLPAGGWTWLEVTGTAPAGAAGAVFGPAETGTPSSSAVLVLGEGTLYSASAEFPYEDDIQVSYDKSLLYNDAQITTIGPQGQSTGPVIVQDPVSIGQHGDSVYQVTSSLSDPGQVIDSGQWLVNTAGTPQLRVDQVTVNASANPFAVEFVLGVEVGDICLVNRRPAGAAQPLSLLLQVITVKKTIDFGSGTLQAQLALNPYPGGSVLSADDPVHGLLNGSNLLPW